MPIAVLTVPLPDAATMAGEAPQAEAEENIAEDMDVDSEGGARVTLHGSLGPKSSAIWTRDSVACCTTPEKIRDCKQGSRSNQCRGLQPVRQRRMVSR